MRKNAANQRRWYKKNSAKKIEYQRLWRAKNPEKAASIWKRWRKNNPEKRAAQRQKAKFIRRGGIMRNTDTPITFEEQEEIYNKACKYGKCPLCGVVPSKWTMDHAIPVIRGGGHTKDNIYYCCPHCNFSKGRKTLEEFWGNGIEEIPYL